MTVIVGVLCKDGVVVGADSAVTFTAGQVRTIEQTTQKIEIIDDRVIVAGTGAVGMGQRFKAVVEKAWYQKVFQHGPIESGKALSAEAIKDFQSTAAPTNQFGALVAFPCKADPQLCEFDIGHFQPELKTNKLWYVSMGSGQSITDPFLGFIRKVFWHEGPPAHQDAVFAVTWAIQQAIDLNTGGVNGPIQLAILTRNKKGDLSARLLSEDELAEHRVNVDGAVGHLRQYAEVVRGARAEMAPEIPKP